jgi:hypothetical protein
VGDRRDGAVRVAPLTAGGGVVRVAAGGLGAVRVAAALPRRGRGAGADSERDGAPWHTVPFIPPVWYYARPWDPPITVDAAWL